MNIKKKKITIVVFLTLILIISLLALDNSIVYYNKINVKNVMLLNNSGTYTKCQIIYPVLRNNLKKFSLVTLGHGFKGSMNSGGAEELSRRLAMSGFATIRMDYNHYIDSKCSRKTDEYTINSMIDDQLLAIDYMVDNYNIDRKRIGLYARSMGGRIAMIMANKNIGNYDYKAMVLVAPAGTNNAMKYYLGGRKKWENMKQEALRNDYIYHQGLKLKREWFDQFDEYDPSKDGKNFNNSVLVIYNDLDKVVTKDTSIECAKAYENYNLIQVNSEDGHGYEMSYENSILKEKLFSDIIEFFSKNL